MAGKRNDGGGRLSSAERLKIPRRAVLAFERTADKVAGHTTMTESDTPDDDAKPDAAEAPPKRHFRRVAAISLLLLALGLSAWAFSFWRDWSRLEPLEPCGGIYFPKRVELAVPSFRQNDPRWGKDILGATDGTLGAEGCAVSSAAMVMASYGIDTDPQRLNQFLQAHDGFTPQGWIYWEKAAELAPGTVQKEYEDLPSYRLIDENLLRGNPVIVRVKLANGITHFVVIAGKDGCDYLIRDPGAGASRGMYPIRELGSMIYALRYYARLR